MLKFIGSQKEKQENIIQFHRPGSQSEKYKSLRPPHSQCLPKISIQSIKLWSALRFLQVIYRPEHDLLAAYVFKSNGVRNRNDQILRY
jgi:hypothetical protein